VTELELVRRDGGEHATDVDEVIGAALILATAVAVAVVALDPGQTIRALTVGAYLAVVPGVAALRAAGARDPWTIVALGVPLSLAIDGTAALVLLTIGIWQPTLSMLLIAGVTLVLILIERVR
jgi:hypothetical protein